MIVVMRMDDFLKGIANDHRNDLLISANDGFDMSLEIIGYDLLINGVIKKVILEDKGKSVGTDKIIAAKLGDISIGDIVIYKNQPWLISDIPVDNDVYLKAPLRLCNSTYPIKANKTRLLRGHNSLNKPIYEEVYEVDTTTPCIVQMGTDSTNTDAQLVIPRNMMYLTLQYQQSDTLDYNYEFEMYNNKYKIIDMDYTKVINEKGIIKIIAERV